jgi:protein-disulfide isomerase
VTRLRGLGGRGAVLRAAAAVVCAFALSGCGGADRAADGSQPSSPGPSGAVDASGVAGVDETAALFEGIPQDGLVLGDKRAPITMVEILDLQCPFCRKHQLQVQPKVIKTLVRTGRVQLHLVPVGFLGADSVRMEIVLLRLAEHDQAWQFANLAYWNQQQEGSGYATDAWLRQLVRAIPGANPADADALASTTPSEAITQTAQVAGAIAQASVRAAGGGGTPFFTIGRTGTAAQELTPIMSGAPPHAYETILSAVKAIESGGTPAPYRATKQASSAAHQGAA